MSDRYGIQVTFDDGSVSVYDVFGDYDHARKRYYHIRDRVFDRPKLDVRIIVRDE